MPKYYMLSDIAKKNNVSKANVSQLLKKGMEKIYKQTIRNNLADGPFQAYEYLINLFNIDYESGAHEFFNAFPKNIQEKIKRDVSCGN